VTRNDHFFQTKGAAAVLKHGILSRYPTVFATMAGSTSAGGRVVYLDGYAGPGQYEPEEGEPQGAPGSPLLAIRTAKTVQQWKRDMHCIFVERKKAYARNLHELLGREAEEGLNYEVLQGDVEQHIDHVLSQAHESPLFAFLDPFGTAMPYDDFRHKLLERDRGRPTEVLLNFSVQSVSRFGGLLTGDEEDEEKTGSGKSATLARLDRFLGSAWWRDEFRDARLSDEDGSAARAAMHVVERFQAKVQKDTGFGSFPVPIRRRPHHHPLFVMLLFFRHQVAPWMFNESVSKANEEWRHHQHAIEVAEVLESQPAKDEPFDLRDWIKEVKEKDAKETEKRLKEEWINLIAGNIRSCVENGPVPVAAHVGDVLGTTLGLAREMHVNRAWDRLADENIVTPRNKSAKTRKQTIHPVSR
jgi:three-Cys-motif partner protein